MSLDQPTHDLRGLVIPDARILGAPLTATSQAGPKAGVPVAQGPTALTLEATGEVTQTVSVEVATQRAGLPGQDATFAWRDQGGTDWTYWDPPWLVTAWEFIARTTTPGEWVRPHGIRRPSGRALVVAIQNDTTVVAWRQNDNGTWSSATVASAGTTTCADVAEDAGGRLYCWYVTTPYASRTQIRMKYSDDDGATWTLGSDRCLPEAAGYSPSDVARIRVALVEADVLLLVWTTGATDTLYQYASSVLGARFDTVETSSTADVAAPDLFVRDRTIYLATVEHDATITTGSTEVPYLRTLTSAYQSIAGTTKVLARNVAVDVKWGTYAAGVFSRAECALFVDDDGCVYIYGLDHNAGAGALFECVVTRSNDGGTTWQEPWVSEYNAGTVILYQGDANTYLRDIAVIPERGRALLVHRFKASPGIQDDSLCVAYLGGWTTVPMPEVIGYGPDTSIAGWELLYLPLDKPEDVGGTWTEAHTGSPVTVLTSDGLSVTQGGGEAKSWATNPTVAALYAKDGFVEVFDVQVASGSSYIDLRLSNGAGAFSVRVTVTSSSLQLRDLVAGANIGSAATIDATSGVQVLVALENPTDAWATNGGQVSVWYAQRGSLGVPLVARTWTALASSSTLHYNATATSLIEMGGLLGAAAFQIRMLGATWAAYAAQNGLTTAPPGRGRLLCTSATPAHVTGGLRLSGSRGPTLGGESWLVDTDHDYPVTAIDPSVSASPRRRWRSTSTVQQDLVWSIDAGWPTGELLAVYLQGINFRTASLFADSGGATKICDLDAKIGTGLAYTRTRDVVYPTGGAGSNVDVFLHEMALAGASFQYGPGGDVRRVKRNTSGSWLLSAASSYRGARLELDSYDAGDPGNGTNGILWSDRVLVVTDLPVSTATLMLRIPAQDVAEDYVEMGTCIIGRFVPFGRQYGETRSQIWRPNYQLSETRSGGRRVRQAGPQRAMVEFDWSDGVDLSCTYGTAPKPDYLTLGYSGAPPAAVRGADLSSLLAGVLARIGGALVPVVYVPALPQAASAPTATAPLTLTDPHRMLYGRLMSEELRADTATGNEFQNPGEVVRISRHRIEEEI